jgi:hypothetical protein
MTFERISGGGHWKAAPMTAICIPRLPAKRPLSSMVKINPFSVAITALHWRDEKFEKEHTHDPPAPCAWGSVIYQLSRVRRRKGVENQCRK